MQEYLVRVYPAPNGEHRATVRALAGVTQFMPKPGTIQGVGVAATAPGAIVQALAQALIEERAVEHARRRVA